MKTKLALIGFLILTFVNSYGQKVVLEDAFSQRLLTLVAQDSCNEVLPAPEVYNQPRYTAVNENTICFKLPDRNLIPFADDEILNPFVVTVIRNLSTNELFQFPRSVDLGSDSIVVETVQSLPQNTNFAYSTALFVPVCKVDCDDVVDNTQLELYCSTYRDTVFSYQDSRTPALQNIEIPQLTNSMLPPWINTNIVEIQGRLSDLAGVWKARLYIRKCDEQNWVLVRDSVYTGMLGETGYVFQQESRFGFSENLADGCYEFRVEGVDAAHHPESCAPNFELLGNENIPQPGAPFQANLKIDTQPPDSVELSCAQILNSIELSWTSSDSSDVGIGLAGYRILRDGELIATVGADTLTYLDEFTQNTPNIEFLYQIQPYDSLGNIQTSGGSRICPFTRFNPIEMVPEPEFTSGDTNKVFWNGSDEINTYTVFLAIDFDYDNAVSQNVSDTSFVFRNLQDGVIYSYWVRATDMQGRIIISDTVRSIQDASFPEISEFGIHELIELNDLFWTRSRDIALSLSAIDLAPGRLDSLELVENGQVLFADQLQTSELTDREINYALATQSCSEIELFARIYDAAGNASVSDTITFLLDNSKPSQVDDFTCVQMSRENGIELNWVIPEDIDDCSGLAGLKIIRDGQEISEVSPDTRIYEDVFEENTSSGVYTYQIQPFDSLGNLQTEGGFSTCEYVGASSITIQSLPRYTQGLATEICWSIDGALDFLNVYVDANCDSVAEDSVGIEQPASDRCYAFTGLEDGQKYCFWLSGKDSQQRSVTSFIVSTIQDNTPPIIENFAFPDGEIINEQIWTYTRDIRLNIVARDLNNGQIWDYYIEEEGLTSQRGEFPDSLSAQNEKIAYRIMSETNNSTQINLRLKVIDGAGNESENAELTVYLQESAPNMFAFPNPFNPLQETLTIRLNQTEETELNIYDFFGNLVRTLSQKSNAHDFIWDGRNGDNDFVANGGYICVGKETETRFKIGVVKEN